MGGADDVGYKVEKEGDNDGDVVDFEEECFAFEPFRGLLWVVVEHLYTSTGWIGVVVPVDLFFALESHLGCCISCFRGSGAEVFHDGAANSDEFLFFRFIF